MKTCFLKNDDSRLEKVSDFEIQTIAENGDVVKIDWYMETTFIKIYEMLEKVHKEGFYISYLDKEGELQSIVRPKAEDKKHYVVMPY